MDKGLPSQQEFQRNALLASGVVPFASMQQRNTATASVVSPGQTQVIRPSQQQTARRASAPQAGASSSLITEAPSPAEVALATTSLLGG